MDSIFTKDFIKFLLGFTALITLALLLIFLLRAQVDQPGTPETQTLPATTTTSQ
jgi:hypothetical protein